MYRDKTKEPLTNWINLEKMHRGPQDAVKHAVVKGLRRAHQDVEKDQAANEAKHHGCTC